MKDINITIVNWKMRDDIDHCLEGLFADIKDSGLDIVTHIIDNSNNIDGIAEMLKAKYPQVVYYNPGRNMGFGAGHNYAQKLVPAKFYLALNPDIEFVPNTDTIKKLLAFFDEYNQVAVLSPRVLNFDGTLQYSCLRFPKFFDPIIRRLNLNKKFKFLQKRVDKYLMVDFDHTKIAPIDFLTGAFLLVKKEFIDQFGLFDERFFMYFEDCDLCRKAWANGYKVYYDADVVVKHKLRRQSADGSPLTAVFLNPVARMHIKSWLKYFHKWGIKNKHYGV